MLLQVQNLNISFNNNIALNNISFNVNTGETLGIVGESGSGKTLTGLAILGLLPKNATIAGNINLNYNNKVINLLTLPQAEKRQYRGKIISMIFQEPMTALNPVIKCGKQVQEVILLHQQISKNQAKQQVISIFEEVKLPNPIEVYNKYPHQLSGGQRQRVSIAMAVACKPLLIIADEPTTALDVTIQKSVLDLLKELQLKHNMAIIFISHDLSVINSISNNVLVLNNGQQVEYGSINHVMHHSKNAYTKALWACSPTMQTARTPLKTVNDFLTPQQNKEFNQAPNRLLSVAETTVNEAEIRLLSEAETNMSKAPMPINKTQTTENNSNIPLIEIKNLNLSFTTQTNFWGKAVKQFKALNNINFVINKDETVGLVGESGSGKTSLGRAIMQLLQTQSGQITYNGQLINNLNKSNLKEYRRKVQLIFQDPYSSLNPWQKVGNAVIEPMLVHGIFNSKQQCLNKATELFLATGLNETFLNRYPHQLSGGQRQRVVIARALALQPQLIICDESVAALDVSVQAQVLNLLNQLKAQFNLSYIFISHNLAVVKYMSNRIYVMQHGNIVEHGIADVVCSQPQHAYTKHLLSAV